MVNVLEFLSLRIGYAKRMLMAVTGRQFLRLGSWNSVLRFASKKMQQVHQAPSADAFSNHKAILKVQQVYPTKSFTFLNSVLMLEILKSFIPECLCFTSCEAQPQTIHDRLQQRQIMVEC